MKYPFIDVSHILIVIFLLTRLLQTMNDKQIVLPFVSLSGFITFKLFDSFKRKTDAKRDER